MNKRTAVLSPKEVFHGILDFERIIILLYLVLSSPFLFSGIWFSNFLIPYFLKLALLIIIIFRSLKHRPSSQSILLIGLCVLYTLLNFFLHPNSAGQSIGDLEDIIFAFFCWELISKSKNRGNYVRFLLFLSFIIASLLLLETLLFLINPSLFSYGEVVGYEVFYNKVLGNVSIDNERPCWFFAEPSYCGAFLLWAIYIFRNYEFPTKKWKHFYYLIILLGFVSTASFGSFVVFGITFAILLAKKLLSLHNVTVVLCLILTISLYLTVFQSYEATDSSLIRTHSMAARQERVEMGKELRNQMGGFDLLFGMGVNAAAFKNGIGLSDAYNKMFVENGVLFLLLYLFIIYRMLKQDIIVFSSIVLSLMTVIVQIFPLTLITIIIASNTKEIHGIKKRIT